MTQFRSIPPVQQFDEAACWAACFEWWSAATSRAAVRQDELIRDFDSVWNSGKGADYGTVSLQGLQTIIGHSRWNMRRQVRDGSSITLAILQEYLAAGPFVLGYFQPGLGNHVVVGFEAHTGPERISVMDPNGAQFRDLTVELLSQTPRLVVGWPR